MEGLDDANHDSPDESGGSEMAGGITISEQQIEGWKSELQSLDAQLAELNEKKIKIQRKLAAITELEDMREGGARSIAADAPQTFQTGTLTLVDAIPEVLRMHNKPMQPGEIRDRLSDVGFNQSFAASYFYTAVQRAFEKKTIIRTHDKKYVFNLLR